MPGVYGEEHIPTGSYFLRLAENTPMVPDRMPLHINPCAACRRNAEYWWIHSVYVVHGHRGTGTFKAMYEYVEKEAREAGAAGLKLYTETTNERAQKAYTKMGMENHALVFENVWLKH